MFTVSFVVHDFNKFTTRSSAGRDDKWKTECPEANCPVGNVAQNVKEGNYPRKGTVREKLIKVRMPCRIASLYS